MKYAFLTFLCILPLILCAQNRNSPQQAEIIALRLRKAKLERQIKTCQDSIQQIDQQIAASQARAQAIADKYTAVNQAIGSGITVKTSKLAKLGKTADPTEGWTIEVPPNSKVTVLYIDRYPYYKVQYGEEIGYIAVDHLDLKKTKLFDLDSDLARSLP